MLLSSKLKLYIAQGLQLFHGFTVIVTDVIFIPIWSQRSQLLKYDIGLVLFGVIREEPNHIVYIDHIFIFFHFIYY